MLDSCHLTFCSIVSDFVSTSFGLTVFLKEVQFQNAYEKSEYTITLKMVDQGRSDFYEFYFIYFYHKPLHTRIETNVYNKFAISSHTVLK